MPKKIMNTAVIKKTLLAPIKNSFEKSFTLLTANIFDKFYTTKGAVNGSGLGLSIVKNVVQEHDAIIVLFSDKKKTQFKITFNKAK